MPDWKLYGFMNMDFIIISILALILVFSICSLLPESKQAKEQREKQRIEKEKILKEQTERRAKEQAEIQTLWNERVKNFGEPTKIFEIFSNPLRNVAIYEPLKIVFINGTKYDFCDILTCRLETKTRVTKGKETHITKPDKDEMAIEQLLWGMGKKYNVKSKTEIIKEPDKISNTYIVYIGVNDISAPQEKITCYSSDRANELVSVMSVIIERNK